MTNVDAAKGLKAPMARFINVKLYPPGDYRGVSTPNAGHLWGLPDAAKRPIGLGEREQTPRTNRR